MKAEASPDDALAVMEEDRAACAAEVEALRAEAEALSEATAGLVLDSLRAAIHHDDLSKSLREHGDRVLDSCLAREPGHHDDDEEFRGDLHRDVSLVAGDALTRVRELAEEPSWREVLVRDAALATVAPLRLGAPLAVHLAHALAQRSAVEHFASAPQVAMRLSVGLAWYAPAFQVGLDLTIMPLPMASARVGWYLNPDGDVSHLDDARDAAVLPLGWTGRQTEALVAIATPDGMSLSELVECVQILD